MIAAIYYAGHEIEVEGANYVIPADADIRDEVFAPYQTPKLELLIETVETIKCVGVVFVDACRNTPFLDGIARPETSESLQQGLKRFAKNLRHRPLAQRTPYKSLTDL